MVQIPTEPGKEDTNISVLLSATDIDGDDEWGETFPQLFKRNYDGEFLFLSGVKMRWNDNDNLYEMHVWETRERRLSRLSRAVGAWRNPLGEAHELDRR